MRSNFFIIVAGSSWIGSFLLRALRETKLIQDEQYVTEGAASRKPVAAATFIMVPFLTRERTFAYVTQHALNMHLAVTGNHLGCHEKKIEAIDLSK